MFIGWTFNKGAACHVRDMLSFSVRMTLNDICFDRRHSTCWNREFFNLHHGHNIYNHSGLCVNAHNLKCSSFSFLFMVLEIAKENTLDISKNELEYWVDMPRICSCALYLKSAVAERIPSPIGKTIIKKISSNSKICVFIYFPWCDVCLHDSHYEYPKMIRLTTSVFLSHLFETIWTSFKWNPDNY